MTKKSKWFWNYAAGPWFLWGIWYKQRAFIGVSVIRKGEEWTE